MAGFPGGLALAGAVIERTLAHLNGKAPSADPMMLPRSLSGFGL